MKLIAEPWDVGPGGYQVGNFPVALDGVERPVPRHRPRLLEGRAATLGEFALPDHRLPDLYEHDGRRPVASINFVTAHDGFTLARPGQLRLKAQRGERREEQGRHGRQPLLNCGVEGPTTTRRSTPCGRVSSAISSRRCCFRRACRDLRGRRARTHAGGNNNPTPRTTDFLADRDHRGPGAHRLHRRARAAAEGASVLSSLALLRRPPGRPWRGRAAAGHRLAADGRPRSCPRRTGTPVSVARLPSSWTGEGIHGRDARG